MIDERILAMCARQHGAISVRQLLDVLGFDASRIYRLRRDGVLVRVTSRVLRIASTPESFLTRCFAVQLHTGGGGFLSGWTAGRLHGLRRMPTSSIHYTIPAETRITVPDWVALHRSRWYRERRDRVHREDDLLVAVPERMLFGLGAAFTQSRFENAAEDAWHLGLTSPRAMALYLDVHRCRGKDGVGTVERWLERALAQDRAAQSGLEIDLLQALSRAGLPDPIPQYPLRLRNGDVIHLDIAWPDNRLAIEPGASWWHGGDARQRRDQYRDLACAEVGWQIIRLDESLARNIDAAARRIRILHRTRTATVAGHPSAGSVE